MGNSLSIFCSWFRRRFWPHHWHRARLVCEAFPAGWAHLVAPAPMPAPGTLGYSRFLFYPQRHPGPSFPARWDGAPTRLCLLPQNRGTPPRVPPPVVWSPPSRKKPVLSARNSMMFGHPSTVRIPRLRCKFNLRLPSLDKQVIPARLPKTEEEPEEPVEVDQVETQGQEDEKRGPCSNGEAASTSRPLETQGNLTFSWCSPRPLEGNVHLKSLTKKNQSDKAQVHAVSFYSKGHGVSSSHGPAGGDRAWEVGEGGSQPALPSADPANPDTCDGKWRSDPALGATSTNRGEVAEERLCPPAHPPLPLYGEGTFIPCWKTPSTGIPTITHQLLNSTAAISTITARASDHLTLQPPLGPQLFAMDMTPATNAVAFRSSPSSRVSSLLISQIKCTVEAPWKDIGLRLPGYIHILQPQLSAHTWGPLMGSNEKPVSPVPLFFRAFPSGLLQAPPV
ncbi:PREDICTED: nuclear pore-associated protein 1-like [Cercocebus atys]|uniref:nuclear pore-associated protein 1-like n=1 Tax=Cercocebus atys TaxID=9531 RepID=UPI0005F480EA|nr:PREDICTED: nuclear pore-associated protein 1-like [Cercocebus atys]